LQLASQGSAASWRSARRMPTPRYDAGAGCLPRRLPDRLEPTDLGERSSSTPSGGNARNGRKIMKTVIVDAALEQRMRTWLATTLNASSTWRHGKAAQYEGDPRNSNSMVALSSA